eukprot:2113998-Rhodomonas_salina.1
MSHIATCRPDSQTRDLSRGDAHLQRRSGTPVPRLQFPVTQRAPSQQHDRDCTAAVPLGHTKHDG